MKTIILSLLATFAAVMMTAACKTVTQPTTTGSPCTAYPKISNQKSVATDSTHATVSWVTDCLSDSQVSWAKGGDDNPTYSTDIFDSLTGVTNHSVLVELNPGTNILTWVRSRSIADTSQYGFQSAPNMTTAGAVATDPFDYGISLGGSHQVFQGNTVYISFSAGLKAGTDNNYLYVTVTGLPPNATLVPDIYATGCSYSYNQSKNEIFMYRTTSCGTSNFGIYASGLTPPGKYELSINYRNANPKSVKWPLTVEPVPVFTVTKPKTYPAIPCLNKYSGCTQNWEDQMITYGKKWCLQEGPAWEGAVWYYDGTRVYYNVRDWDTKYHVTGDPSQWTACIEKQNELYKNYVNGLSSITGYRVFSHGLARHYKEQQDDASKQALLKIRNAAYNTPKEGSLIGNNFVRELSYRLEADLIDITTLTDDQTATRKAYLKKWYEISLGRADQYLTGQIQLQPFMTGLWFESMITCYENQACPGYQDPRIPTVVKRVADYIWPYYGITKYQDAWPYYLPSFVMTPPGAQYWCSLNLLINHAYSWLWALTGESKYQQRSDQAWKDGVMTKLGDGADFSGKNYSQQYRLSFDSVKYRANK